MCINSFVSAKNSRGPCIMAVTGFKFGLGRSVMPKSCWLKSSVSDFQTHDKESPALHVCRADPNSTNPNITHEDGSLRQPGPPSMRTAGVALLAAVAGAHVQQAQP